MLNKTLQKITRLLDNINIPYMLIGGYAMTVHGIPRLTQDLDISLGVDIKCLQKILNTTRPLFKPISKEPANFAKETNVLLLQDIETGIRVDLIFTFIDFERQAISEAVKIKIEDSEINCVSLENLIVYKMLAGRERDKEDVELILSSNFEKLNFDKISKALEELSAILESDAYKNWKNILVLFNSK